MNGAVNPEVMLHLDLLGGFDNVAVGVLTMGFFYGLTLCSLSCLPVIAPYLFSAGTGFKKSLHATGIFVAAKIATYSFLGAVSGAFGSIFLERIPQDRLLVANGLVIVVVGLLAWRGKKSCIGYEGSCHPATGRHMAVLGLVTSLMPCLPLSAVLLYAASSQSMVTGAVMAFLFGLGTAASPLYYFGGGSAGWLAKRIGAAIPDKRLLLQRFSSVVLMLMGFKLLIMGAA